MRTRRACIAAMVAALCALAGADAASAVVPGGLVATGCLSSAAAPPCTPLPQVGTPTDVAVSPDGANVYVTTSVPSLVVYRRDVASGQLTLRQCYQTAARGGCQALPIAAASTLSSPTAIAITPDGAHVYVANSGNSTIHGFNRDSNDGALYLKAAGSSCIANSGGGIFPCDDAEAMMGTADLAIAGNVLYVASSNAASGGVTALVIGPGGRLIQPSDAGGGLRACATGNAAADEGCTFSRGLSGASSLVVTNNKVYAATNAGRLVTIDRDPATGQLVGGTTPAACLTGAATPLCTTVPELAAGIASIALSNEAQVYAVLAQATNTEGVVTQSGRVLTFDASGQGLARRPGAAGCVSNGAAANCTTGRALGANANSQVITTPDGADVYASGTGVVELNRGGNLAPRNDDRGCVHPTALANCSPYAQLGTPTGLAIAPDGRHLYAVSSGRITTLRRDSSGPVCDNVAITVQHQTVQELGIPCSDPDGDPLTFSTVNPPTLGTIGGFDDDARTVRYAAPLGQNGSTTMSFRASYRNDRYGAFYSDGSIQVHVVGAPVVVPAGIDADGDGFTAGQDCNDTNRNIRPGSPEIKGNNIDENCDGVAEPFPTLASGVLHNWSYTKRGTTFTLRTLKITQQFPKGWKVTIKCSGKKCPFRSKTLKASKVKKSASSVISSLSSKQRRFRVGQTVEVWVSAPSFNTKVARITLKRGKQPAIVPYCVLPGSTKVQKTCT